MVVLNFVRNSATFLIFRSQNHNLGRICDRFSRNLEHCVVNDYCMDLNKTWQGCCTTSLEVHVGR